MEKTLSRCTLTSLAALVVLVSCPAGSWCKEDAYRPLTEAKPACCGNKDAVLKRFDDIDYDSFVSLMGRRSAAQPNGHRNAPVPRKRNGDHVLADLLGRRTRMACPCTQEYLLKIRG